jgi:hypothetical protein
METPNPKLTRGTQITVSNQNLGYNRNILFCTVTAFVIFVTKPVNY